MLACDGGDSGGEGGDPDRGAAPRGADSGTASERELGPDASTPPAPDAKQSSPGVYEGHSERIYSGFEIQSQYVEVRDGTKLAMDIYRPLETDGSLVEAPLPVLWMHTPYGRRAPFEVPGFTIGEMYPGTAARLVDYVYVIAVVDFRGLYASYGRNAGYNRAPLAKATCSPWCPASRCSCASTCCPSPCASPPVTGFASC